MARPLMSLALTLLLIAGCASRQERRQLESAEVGLVLLDREASRPLAAELETLFTESEAMLSALPERTRGWLSPLAPAIRQLRARSQAVAASQPEALQQALSPYRTLARYPIVYEQVKVPADVELAPVVTEANRQLLAAWRIDGALWLAGSLEPLLRQESTRLAQRGEIDRIALGIASLAQLYSLLQAHQSAQGLPGDLEQTQRRAELRLNVLQARLRADPRQGRILRDDIQLVSALIESLLHVRTHLLEDARRFETLTIQAGDRVQAIVKTLP